MPTDHKAVRRRDSFRQAAQILLVVGGDIDVLDGATFRTDDVVVVAPQPLCEFEEGKAAVVVRSLQHTGFTQHRQRAIERRQRYVEPHDGVKFSSGARTACGCEESHYSRSARCVADVPVAHPGANPLLDLKPVGSEQSRSPASYNDTDSHYISTLRAVNPPVIQRTGTIMRIRFTAAAVVGLLCITSCGPAGDSDTPRGLLVVATTSIVGGITAGVVGDGGRVEVLMSASQDPHSYRASAQQIARMRQADLVVASGLGLELALLDTLEAAAGDGVRILWLGDFVDPLPKPRPGDEPDERTVDPHFWFDPIRVAKAVEALGVALADVDPEGAAAWRENADAYRRRVLDTHEQLVQLISALATSERKLVTNHDSLQYFAARYGFEVVGTVLAGTSTIAKPSPAALSRLVAAVRECDIQTIFAESTHSTRLAEAIAEEAGSEIEVVELLTGALGDPGSGADTYLGFLETTVRRIVQALAA